MSLESTRSVAGMLLGVVVAIVTAELRMVSEGRWAFADRAVLITSWMLPVSVAVGFAHVAMTWYQHTNQAPNAEGRMSHERLQLVMTISACVGAAAIAADAWDARSMGGWAVHDLLRERLGQPIWLGVYLVTSTALAFAFGLGLRNVVDRFGLPTRSALDPGLLAGGVGGLIVWAALIDSLGSLILGTPALLPTGSG